MIKDIILKKYFWIIFLIYNLFIFNSVYFSPYFYTLSIGIFFLNIFPLIVFFLNYKNINHIPLFYFTHLYFFFCYTIALFFPIYSISILNNDILGKLFLDPSSKLETFLDTTIIYLIGLFFFNLSNYISLYFLKDNFKPNKFFNFKENNYEVLILGILTYVLSLIFLFANDLEIFKKLYQIKYPLTYLSLICFQLYIILKRDLHIVYKFTLYVLIFVVLFFEILDGSIAKSFLYFISIYLINFIVTKKINFKLIFAFVLVCILLHSFKYEYRNVTWGHANINSQLSNYENAEKEAEKIHNTTDKIKLLMFTYFESIQNIKNKEIKKTFNTLIKRNYGRLIHSFKSLLIVVGLSPQHVPHWDGYSYKIFASKFIPRIFWNEKPSDTLGNEFGKRYKVLNISDQGTSWNMPVLNEFFVNFGLVGVIMGMFFLGLIFSSVPLLLNYRYDNYLFIITFITLYPLFFLESHFSLNFGAVIQTFIFLMIYLYFFKKFLLIMKRIFKLSK